MRFGGAKRTKAAKCCWRMCDQEDIACASEQTALKKIHCQFSQPCAAKSKSACCEPMTRLNLLFSKLKPRATLPGTTKPGRNPPSFIVARCGFVLGFRPRTWDLPGC